MLDFQKKQTMTKKVQRIMVDMSATIIHHGHIRILKFSKKKGSVIVALTSDEEIIKNKGIKPPFTFDHRKEVLQSIKYVDEVVKSKWYIDEKFLEKHKIDYLVHGTDNKNPISNNKLKIVRRTKGISSTKLRKFLKKIRTL